MMTQLTLTLLGAFLVWWIEGCAPCSIPIFNKTKPLCRSCPSLPHCKATQSDRLRLARHSMQPLTLNHHFLLIFHALSLLFTHMLAANAMPRVDDLGASHTLCVQASEIHVNFKQECHVLGID